MKSVQESNGSVTYTYDTQGQLTKAVDTGWYTTYNYTYDNAGNILSKSLWSEYDGNEGSVTYTYGNESWPDLLTEVNGQPIAYEGQSVAPLTGKISGTVESGNPISYFNGNTRWSFTWENGRQLATASFREGNTGTTIDYAYDLNGYRTSKTVVTKTYETVRVHNYVTTVVAATCTEGGYTLHQCACGESYRTDETAALGHNYVASGTGTYTCTRCGDTYTDHTHSYTSTVVEPTCTESGYTLHECACGYSYQDNVVEKLGHNYKVVKQTSTTATYQCTRCGDRYSAPIAVIDPPNPPISSYSLEADGSSFTQLCGVSLVLKSITTEEHSYTYAGGRLLRETITTTAEDGTVSTKVLDFAYDAQGTPYSLTYTNGTASPATYYYITNLQGDVMYLINNSGTKVASYSYDPYGKITYATGTMAQINPLRYRGYYYDNESSFYYLQSRYYDATICRFINADNYTATGNDILGHNMFAYCSNNPISRNDDSGEFWNIVIGAIVGAVAGVVTQVVSNAIAGNDLTAGVASAAIVGAAGGAIAATGLGPIAQAGATALASGVGDAVQQGIDKGWDKIDPLQVTKTALVGGATSLIGSYAGKKFLGGIEDAGNALISKGHQKASTGVLRALSGKSHTSYYRSSIKLVTRGKNLVNFYRGVSSCLGSGIGILTGLENQLI